MENALKFTLRSHRGINISKCVKETDFLDRIHQLRKADASLDRFIPVELDRPRTGIDCHGAGAASAGGHCARAIQEEAGCVQTGLEVRHHVMAEITERTGIAAEVKDIGEPSIAAIPGQNIVSGSADDDVLTVPANDDVIAGTSIQKIIAVMAMNAVIAAIAEDHVILRGADDIVEAGQSIGIAKGIGGCASLEIDRHARCLHCRSVGLFHVIAKNVVGAAIELVMAGAASKPKRLTARRDQHVISGTANDLLIALDINHAIGVAGLPDP